MENVAENFKPIVCGKSERDQTYFYGTKKGNFQTFSIPDEITETTRVHIELGKELIRAFRTDGLLQIEVKQSIIDISKKAYFESENFFKNNSLSTKLGYVNDLSYSGYIGVGDEKTNNQADGSEVFTITPDIALNDRRVEEKWPCHGPVPWPAEEYKTVMTSYMSEVGKVGDNLLKLMALGLGIDINCIYDIVKNGWHHMRVLRVPAADKIALSEISRGVGSHTDYGLLVLLSQDDVGGLYIRPPIEGEMRLNNWLENNSMAGMYENDEPWIFVQPVENVLAVFPGDMFQLLTDGYILSTPHKVSLHPHRERFSIAYFHEPAFDVKIKNLDKFASPENVHSIEYGTHFTNMLMRGLSERSVTKKLKQNNYKKVLRDIFSNATK